MNLFMYLATAAYLFFAMRAMYILNYRKTVFIQCGYCDEYVNLLITHHTKYGYCPCCRNRWSYYGGRVWWNI